MRECIYVESVEFEPIGDGNVRFSFATGHERLMFCMARSVVMQAAHEAMDILRQAETTDRAKLARLR